MQFTAFSQFFLQCEHCTADDNTTHLSTISTFHVNLKNSATNLFGVSSLRSFSSLDRVCYDDNYFFTDFRNVGYTSLSVASLNTFNRSLAIANSDLSTLWTSR